MTLRLQPVLVPTGEEGEGCLVFDGDWLMAVLVRLSRLQGENSGAWFLEKGFDGLDAPHQPVFADLDAAQAWISARLREHPKRRSV